MAIEGVPFEVFLWKEPDTGRGCVRLSGGDARAEGENFTLWISQSFSRTVRLPSPRPSSLSRLSTSEWQKKNYPWRGVYAQTTARAMGCLPHRHHPSETMRKVKLEAVALLESMLLRRPHNGDGQWAEEDRHGHADLWRPCQFRCGGAAARPVRDGGSVAVKTWTMRWVWTVPHWQDPRSCVPPAP